jgi:hypothetical protein
MRRNGDALQGHKPTLLEPVDHLPLIRRIQSLPLAEAAPAAEDNDRSCLVIKIENAAERMTIVRILSVPSCSEVKLGPAGQLPGLFFLE